MNTLKTYVLLAALTALLVAATALGLRTIGRHLLPGVPAAGMLAGLASRQKLTSRSVSPAIAETTTATSCPASCWRFTMPATRLMRSVPAIEVPPNFITMRATSCGAPALENACGGC